MRTDTVMGDTTRTMIFDIDAQRMYRFDSKKKEADVVGHAGVRRQHAAERRQVSEHEGVDQAERPDQADCRQGRHRLRHGAVSVPATMGGEAA